MVGPDDMINPECRSPDAGLGMKPIFGDDLASGCPGGERVSVSGFYAITFANKACVR